MSVSDQYQRHLTRALVQVARDAYPTRKRRDPEAVRKVTLTPGLRATAVEAARERMQHEIAQQDT